MTIDYINGIFEFASAIFVSINVYKLYKDKQVRGVWWPASLFWFSWGLWNLFYYPSLNQWASFAGGVLICIVNGTWVTLAIYYTRKERYEQNNQKGVPAVW